MSVPSPSDRSTPSIVWISALTDHSGYADEARGFLRALEREGRRPAARERRLRDSNAGLSPADARMIRAQLARTPRQPTVAVHHYIPVGAVKAVEGATNVARTMFETDSIPTAWIGALLERDEIWVPCHHNVETFRAAGIPESKLRVVGETIDFDLFDPAVAPLEMRRAAGEFVFLTNFDFSERKGWRTLLHAWARAFDRDDPVRLVLKTNSTQLGDAEVRERIDGFLREVEGRGLSTAAPIAVMTDTLAPEDMPRLYAGADAYVMPSHGEGWGRPFMEAMAMGLPTIASRWSGNLDFMDDSTSWLVDGGLVPVPLDADPYYGIANGHRWFAADVDELVAALRDVAGDPAAARAKAAGARPDLLARFGPEAITAAVLDAATAALERHGAHRTPSMTIRGTFGSTASLAVVNDRVADGLSDRGWRVRTRGATTDSQGEKTVGLSHSWPPRFEPVTDGPTVVTLPWEFGAPPAEWVAKARAMADRVWVPSEYVRDGYVAGGMPPGIVEVVPNGVDVEAFSPAGPSRILDREAGCVFLFVGGTIWRKGIDVLLRAWRDAFTATDDVLLVVKDFGTATHYRGRTQQDGVAALAADPRVAPILYIEDEVAPDELPALYRAADALVVPYRGEGFCMPALEAMATGRPVIHNGVGPTAEFVPADAGWALPAEKVDADGRGLPDLAGPSYVHEVDHDALVRALRDAAAHPEERTRRGRAARAAALGYSWQHVAERAEALLVELDAEGLTLARDIVPAVVEGHDEVVLFTPDWSRDDDWAAPLLRWVEQVTATDPITLAVHVGDADADAVADRIAVVLESSGRPEDELPDIAMCDPAGVGLEALVARADAILLGASGTEGPAVMRRGRRLLAPEAEQIGAYLAGVRPFAPPVAARA
jgi:glycosyltransferase involved in cell wall biosynthesis